METTIRAVAVAIAIVALGPQKMYTQSASVTLLQEGFEDSNFTSRGWYDAPRASLSSTERYAGNRSLECHFAVGARHCSGGSPMRHAITATDSKYLSYYV